MTDITSEIRSNTLTPAEMNRSLKGQPKSKRKRPPPAKYLCQPTTLRLIQNVITLTETDEPLNTLSILFKKYGHQNTDGLDKYPEKKLEFSHNKTLFWNHFITGINQITRTMENSATSPNPKACDISIILLDIIWLTSPMGHHLALLCNASSTSLFAVSPADFLSNLFLSSIPKRSKTSCAAICLPSIEHEECLSDLFGLIQSIVPSTRRHLSFKNELPFSQRSHETICTSDDFSLHTDYQTIPTTLKLNEIDVKDWSGHIVDCEKVYISPLHYSQEVLHHGLQMSSDAEIWKLYQIGLDDFPIICDSKSSQLPTTLCTPFTDAVVETPFGLTYDDLESSRSKKCKKRKN